MVAIKFLIKIFISVFKILIYWSCFSFRCRWSGKIDRRETKQTSIWIAGITSECSEAKSPTSSSETGFVPKIAILLNLCNTLIPDRIPISPLPSTALTSKNESHLVSWRTVRLTYTIWHIWSAAQKTKQSTRSATNTNCRSHRPANSLRKTSKTTTWSRAECLQTVSSVLSSSSDHRGFKDLRLTFKHWTR